MDKKFSYHKLLQYFLQGLLILAPVAITLYALYFIIFSIDKLIPIFTYQDERGYTQVQNYGLGFLIIIAAIVAIGFFSSFFITGKVISVTNRVLENTPGIKHIYTTSRDFVEAFAGNKKKFTENVLVNIGGDDIWRIGFVTRHDMTEFGKPGYASVYIPMSYSVAGHVYIVPKHKIKPLENISSAQSMKFVVSGGVTELHDVHEEGKEDVTGKSYLPASNEPT